MLKKLFIFSMILSFFATTQVWAAKTIKPHHKENGLSCSDCHTTSPPEAVPMEQCLSCHELPAVKDDYHGPPDKHDSPHYGPELECENCHHEHQESENFCGSCHDFDFTAP